MLILMRRCEESIIIGDNEIEIKVLKVQGNQTHLGISAPREIKVYRKEVFDRMKNEKTAEQDIIGNLKQGCLVTMDQHPSLPDGEYKFIAIDEGLVIFWHGVSSLMFFTLDEVRKHGELNNE